MRKFIPGATETVATGAGVVTAYAAMVLTQRYGVPLEVSAAIVGGAVGIGRRLVRFLADRMPERKKKS